MSALRIVSRCARDGTEALHLIKIKRHVRKREGNARAPRDASCLTNRQASAEGIETLNSGKDKQTEEELVFYLGNWGVSKKKKNQNWPLDNSKKQDFIK